MNIDQILSRIIRTSGRTELLPEIDLLLNQLNDYKLYLQRDKRICFSQTTTLISALAQDRSAPLPSDFLFPIALRRQNTNLCRQLVLSRWMNREEFLTQFPNLDVDGNINTGAPEDYMLLGDSIIFGPALRDAESFYLDYYRIIPEYVINVNMTDDFTVYYPDGLYLKGMLWIWEDWTPDIKRAEAIQKRLTPVEVSLKKFQVNREEPMESTENLPDN